MPAKKEEKNMTLSDIREEVYDRAEQVDDLKNRLENLGKEIEDLLQEIDELEGLKPRKRRGRPRRVDLEGWEDEEKAPPPRRRGRPPKAGKKKAPRKPRPKREGPSVVEVAMEILKETGKPMAPGELAAKVEERGVSTANTQRVLLMTAGRKKSKLAKNEDGAIELVSGDQDAGETSQG